MNYEKVKNSKAYITSLSLFLSQKTREDTGALLKSCLHREHFTLTELFSRPLFSAEVYKYI